MKIRDRIIKVVRVPLEKLRPAPWNFRTHPDRQREVLQGILGEVGNATVLLARPLKDGTYMLIDGHLRLEEFRKLKIRKVRIAVLDVTEAEAKKLLACLDPLAELAGTDGGKLSALIRELETEDQPLASLFSDLSQRAGLKAEDLKLDLEEGGEEDSTTQEEDLSPSHVRMVQLFLNTANIGEFETLVKDLGKKYDTKTLTETILEALRRESRKAQKRSAG